MSLKASRDLVCPEPGWYSPSDIPNFFISTLVSNAIKVFPQKSIQVRKVVFFVIMEE